jgi:hypothetical protein
MGTVDLMAKLDIDVTSDLRPPMEQRYRKTREATAVAKIHRGQTWGRE